MAIVERSLLIVARLAYRCCLGVAPKAFRQRFGPEAEATFTALVRDTYATRGGLSAGRTAIAGCVDALRAGFRERVTWHTHAWLVGATSDLRRSCRLYRQEPIFAGVIVLTLALVSGPTLAAYAAVQSLVLKSLPYRDPDRLVIVGHLTDDGRDPYYPQPERGEAVTDFKTVSAFESVGGARRLGFVIREPNRDMRVQSMQVTGGLLTMLGAQFAAGRDLRPREPEAVITRALALKLFGSIDEAIGRNLAYRTGLTIVGVLASDAPMPGPPTTIDAFIPHPTADNPAAGRNTTQAFVIARLKPGVSREVALEQTRVVDIDVQQRFGEPSRTAILVPFRSWLYGGQGFILAVAVSLVFVVFAIAVASLGSLVLARAAGRMSEVSVRTALGASRWRLIRGWLSDGLVLAIPGILLGVAIGTSLIAAVRSASYEFQAMSQNMDDGLWPMWIGAAVLTVFTGVLFAFAPAIAGLLRSSSSDALREGMRVLSSARRVRTQSFLLTLQVAMSVTLLLAGSWLAASMWRALSRPVGFDNDGLVAVDVRSLRPRDVQIDNARQAVARLQAIGNVDADGVAISTDLPGTGSPTFVPLRIRPTDAALTNVDDQERPRLTRYAVSGNYFRVLGIQLRSGRTFTAADAAAPDRVIIVSRSFEARWFPEGAVGQLTAFGRDELREIVGVVEDIHSGTLIGTSLPQFYVPMTDTSLGVPSVFLLRTPRSASAMRNDVVALFRELDPGATTAVMSASDFIALPLASLRLTLYLIVSLATIALLLAIANAYALTSFGVSQRTREIGIRIALGATATHVVRLVTGRSTFWVTIGIAAGTSASYLLAAPLLEARMFMTRTTEPVLVLTAIGIMCGAALLATWAPVRRAVRVMPATALRHE